MSSHKVLIHLIHHLESILVVATFGQWEGKQTDTGKSWTTLGVGGVEFGKRGKVYSSLYF